MKNIFLWPWSGCWPFHDRLRRHCGGSCRHGIPQKRKHGFRCIRIRGCAAGGDHPEPERQQADGELTVPYDPQRVAVLDMASLDILDALDLGDRVVGSADTSLDYLQSYVTDEAVANLGTIKEADLEAVMACEPDVIFIGGRLASSYDALSEIAPVVYLSTDTELGVVESVRKNTETIASIFGRQEQAGQLMTGFDARIEALRVFAEGKTAIVGMVTSGSYNVLGNDGRCSIIGREIGFENVGVDAAIDTSTHGNEASFEFLVEKDPQYIL